MMCRDMAQTTFIFVMYIEKQDSHDIKGTIGQGGL